MLAAIVSSLKLQGSGIIFPDIYQGSGKLGEG